jgi:hypothetical protein
LQALAGAAMPSTAQKLDIDCIEVICDFASASVLRALLRVSSEVSKAACKRLYASVRLLDEPVDNYDPFQPVGIAGILLANALPPLQKYGRNIEALTFYHPGALENESDHQRHADEAARVILQALPDLPALQEFHWLCPALPSNLEFWHHLHRKPLRQFTLTLDELAAAVDGGSEYARAVRVTLPFAP